MMEEHEYTKEEVTLQALCMLEIDSTDELPITIEAMYHQMGNCYICHKKIIRQRMKRCKFGLLQWVCEKCF